MLCKYLGLFLALFLFTPLFAQNIEPTYDQVSYGVHKDMTLNFWQFESETPVPLLVHIHGGGWLGGKKQETISPHELKRGYSFASIDYRLAGTELLPAAVHDAAPYNFCAPKQRMEFRSARIAVIGGSAGAASSLWLAYHDDMANPKSDDQCFGSPQEFVERLQWAGKPLSILFFLRKRLVQHAFVME